MRRALALTVAGSAVLALCSCSAQLADRGGVDNAAPDSIGDVDWIDVYRNADRFPNIARVCVQGLGFAVPSTGTNEGGGGATPLIRVPDWDTFCAGKAKPATTSAPAPTVTPPRPTTAAPIPTTTNGAPA